MESSEDVPQQRNEAGHLTLPPSITIEETTHQLTIIRRWLTWRVYILIPISIMWNVFAWLMVFIFLQQAHIALWVMLPLALAGAAFAYYTLANLLNHTFIDVTRKDIFVTHRPIPLPGRRMQVEQVSQLFVKPQRYRSNRSYRYTYEVRALLINGQDIPLMTGLKNPESATTIEARIERFLRIEDHPVVGEYRE